MEEKNYQIQLDEVNRKLDLIMEELHFQKQKRESMDDLMTDMTFIGKDMFKSAVVELDNAGIEVDPEAVKALVFSLVRNIGTLQQTFETLESMTDLVKDVGPIARQIGLDSIQVMSDMEQKGYFEFVKETKVIMDNVVEHFSKEDVRALADNVVTIMETLKSITQPDMLEAVNNALTVYKHMDTNEIPEYTLWQTFKELRSPEMRKGLGFMITFLKNMAKQ